MNDWVLSLETELLTFIIYSLWEMINEDIFANFLITILIEQL